jgi:glycosyl transferase, family 25
MNILVINLPNATERLEFQRTQMTRVGLEFERVEAVRGQDIDDNYYHRMAATGPRLMTRNEVGCFLSHLRCWEKCVELDEPVLILEDDAVLSSNFFDLVKEIVKNISTEPLIVSLETFGSKKRVSKKRFSIGGGVFSVYDLAFAGAGACSYIMMPSAAKLCLEKAKKKIGLADLFLFSVRGTQLAQLVPAIAMQLCLFGDIGNLSGAATTSINVPGSGRPTGFESFIANPMTRLRRLKSWFMTVWQRHIRPSENSHVSVVPSDGLMKSLIETKRLLNG